MADIRVLEELESLSLGIEEILDDLDDYQRGMFLLGLRDLVDEKCDERGIE